MHELVLEYGIYGLFLVCFLAATILPFSSEVALFTAVAAGIPAGSALVWASAGNILACVLNYALGYYFRSKAIEKIRSGRWSSKALALWERYGVWSLTLNWAPLIGDPITIAAGIGKLNFWVFFVMVAVLRTGRYILILQLL